MHKSIAALTLLFAAATANAHETWLLPSSFSAEPGESLEFAMTSGMGFPSLGNGIDPSRLSEAVLMTGGERRSLIPSAAREGALVLSGIPEPGLACAWVHLNPRILEIEAADDVQHYLEEIGAPEEVWDAWHQSDELWRESYSKLARTYVSASAADDGATCTSEASDSRFEILPHGNPSVLKPGDTLELQILFDGEPLTGQAIGFIREGEAARPLTRADADGRVTITIDGPGAHMIYATNLRPASGDDFNWESDFTTLTFEVSE